MSLTQTVALTNGHFCAKICASEITRLSLHLSAEIIIENGIVRLGDGLAQRGTSWYKTLRKDGIVRGV